MLRSIRVLAAGLLGTLILLTGSVQAQDAANLPLPENLFPDLKRILDTATKLSPKMIARQTENAIAEQNRIIARSGQLPNAGGYLSYYPWTRDDRADLAGPTTTKKFNYNISINQPLYHWGALVSNTRLGELQQKVAEGQTADAYRMLVQEIRAQYLALIIKKTVLTRAQINLGIMQEQLSVAQGKFERKVISEADLYLPRLNNDQAVLGVDRSTEDLESAKLTFSKLTATPLLTDAQIPNEIPSLTPSQEAFESYLAKFTSQKDPKSFYLDTLRNQIDIEEMNYRIADARLKPKLNAVVGANQDEQSYTSNIAAKYRVQSTYAGISINWSIFDGFAAHSSKAISLARKRQAQRAYEDAVVNLSDQARSAVKQLGFSARSMDITSRMLNGAEGWLHSRQDDVKRGLASEADVSAARLAFVDAQIGALNARFDYLLKTGDFLSMILEDPALVNVPGHTP